MERLPEHTLPLAERRKDRIRGCLLGGAAGDALGYPVEFSTAYDIVQEYGPRGITTYQPDPAWGKALISDDTQMTLFTANGMLWGQTQQKLQGTKEALSVSVALAYRDWYTTQMTTFANRDSQPRPISWLCRVPELYSRRAPGNTCLSALSEPDNIRRADFLEPPVNDSKGCGGVMRVAPLGLIPWEAEEQLLLEAARAAAITHGHPLGYLPASVLCDILRRIVFAEHPVDLKETVQEAAKAVCRCFRRQRPAKQLRHLIDRAVKLAENNKPDVENIHSLGGGWVGEEALAISIYCSLRYREDFSAGIIAAVNHDGDSDSTGAITGNILGALAGYEAIRDPWQKDLELAEVTLELADDLYYGVPLSRDDPAWTSKYVHACPKEEGLCKARPEK